MLDSTLRLALETIQMNKQALIFTPSRASAEKTAEDISKLASGNYPELEQGVLHAASTPTKQCRRLSHCLKKGIAFHHAGLLSAQKELIEEGFKKGTVKIICCTPTLAAGLSLPAFRVIIKSLKRHNGTWGMDWIPVLEYLQMAGRAGRPEYESFGEAISIAKDEIEQEEIYEQYICGVPEEISSKLAVEPALRTYLLSLISSGIIRDEPGMQEFFAKTFWAHQYKDMQKLAGIMEKMLVLLEQWGMVNRGSSHSEFVSARALVSGEKKLMPTVIGKRVSELYIDPLTAKHLLDCLKNFSSKKKSFSLLQMVSHTLEIRPRLRVKVKEEEKIQEQLVQRYDLLLEKEPSAYDPDYEEFIDSIKTALFLEAWIDEKDEDYLMETFDIRPGEIRIKVDTTEWLLYAAEELAKASNMGREVGKELALLQIRVKNGVREDVLPLLKLKGIGRIRARRLVNNGLRNLGDIKKADVTTLGQMLGKALAEDVQKQVGEEIKEIPDGKRKGQLSIRKF